MHERRSRGPALIELENCFEVSSPAPSLRRSAAVHVGLIEYDVGSHVCWPGGQHLLLAVDQIAGVECRQLKSMPVGDRVGRTRFHAIAAKNAAVVIDVVNLGVALGAADAVLGGILGGLDVDAIRRTIWRRTENRLRTFPVQFRRAAAHARRESGLQCARRAAALCRRDNSPRSWAETSP